VTSLSLNLVAMVLHAPRQRFGASSNDLSFRR